MSEATLEALIPKTQELLQPLIAKPKLADKLLAKPPFRFLHDIFTALTQATGFGKGLYNDFELDSANVKEKNQKTAFLDKMIVCVGLALGSEIDVRSVKIVAGLEPENTNMLLQALAQAASNSSLDWAKAVQQTLDKVPSLTPDGGMDIQSGSAGAPQRAEAKSAGDGGSSRPASKEKNTPSEADKAAEAKAREKAKREKEEAEKKERQENEAMRGKAEAKAETAAATAATKKKAQPDNNELDDAVQQQICECNGDFERTKDMIEKIISKPKMAVKLLSKPPFRFLHDVISEITRITGFGEGLYSGEELDSNAIKEKQPKIDYLTKILTCVSCHLNIEVDAKPAKIVAGLEPEDTNKFLQLLAVACRHGNCADAVQRVLSGDTALRASSAGTKKSSSAHSTKSAEREATPETKLSSRSTTPQESKSRSKAEAKEPTQTAAAAPGSFSAPMKPIKPTSMDEDDDGGGNLKFQDAKGINDADDSAPIAPGTSGGFGTSRTSRPTTARRRPPKLKENVTEVGRMLATHDTKIAAVVGLMKDGDNADSDDDGGGDNNSNQGSRPASSSSTVHVEDGAVHGRLVREILKGEKEREEEEAKDNNNASGPMLETETGIRLGRRKKSFKDNSKTAASSAAEMNELRANIQRICQAALPMGKAIEFVHEDLEAMSKELEKWKKEYTKKCEVYEEEKKKTEEALQPLQVQLLEVEEQIKEQVHKINTLKGTIAKNEDKTQKLLRMVVSA